MKLTRWLPITLLILIALMALGWHTSISKAQNANPVIAAWELAKERGAYQFSSDVVQTTTPLATLSNVGRSSRQDELHLEGNTNLQAKSMLLHLWAHGGSTYDANSGLEVKIENGKTQVRQAGGTWQDKGDLASSIAPTGDFMSFLSGLYNIQKIGSETRGGIHFTRYSFTLNGPAVADFVRNQMQKTMNASGELPPGIQLQTPSHYAQMTGNGEIWIDDHGLPLRQILDLAFPPQRDEAVTGHIVTDFTHFAEKEIGDWRLGDWEISPLRIAHTAIRNFTPPLFMLLMGIGFCITVIIGRRSRKLCGALVIAIIFSQISLPLLQNFRIAGYLDTQSARAAAMDDQRVQNEVQETFKQNIESQAFNPLADPTQAADAQAAAATVANSGLPEAAVPDPLTAPNNGQDTDHDGLTDFLEERIGTSVTISDTDGDEISDGQEVLGFSLAGKQWHSDPLSRDSNNDGQPDTTEWRIDKDNNGIPDDTDGDGIPDLFDEDNDGDGIPDAQDLSPYTQLRPGAANSFFQENTPFNYRIDNLQAGKPVFVDFQLRPKEESHLWYALSVLDWPQDVEGQIQDGDNKTFTDVNAANAGTQPNPADAFGDMRLIPMLEVRMKAASANLPGDDDLLAYNTSVNDLTSGGATKVAYVPIRLINDTKSGSRVAFQARMPYKALGSWNDAHEVRLVWVVQALLDLCKSQVDGICVEYTDQNKPEVIQSYYDEWMLTGFSVREDHGSSSALIYEDPAVDNNLKDDGNLVSLAYVLDNTFLAGRDQDGNQQIDMSLSEITRRFDHLSNGAVPIAQRYELSNTLRVESKSYPTLDTALMTTAITSTKQVLDSQFANAWKQDNSLKPVILFAQENQYRSQSLDSLGSNGVTATSGKLTIDFKPGGTQTPVETSVGLKLSMFCSAAGSNPTWEGCDLTTLWDELFNRYAASSQLPGDTPLIGQARMGLIRLFFVVLAQGVTNIVKEDATVIAAPSGFQVLDDELLLKVRAIGKGVAAGVAFITNVITFTPEAVATSVVKQIAGLGAKEFTKGLNIDGIALTKIKKLWASSTTKGKIGGIGVAVVVVVVVLVAAGLLITYLLLNESAKNTVLNQVVPVALPIALALIPVISLTMQAVQIGQLYRGLEFSVGATGALGKILTGSSVLSGTAKASSIVGAVIQVTVVWGMFIYQMVDSKVSVFSPQFNQALAQVIAATILIITLAVLSATVIGLIIVTIIALIDGILTAICELGVDDLRKVPGFDGACFTLNTAATVVLTKLLYSYDSMIDTDRDEMVTTEGPSVQLADPQRGFVANNPISVTLPVTTIVVHKDPKPENWMHILPYIWLFSQDNIKTTSFRYELSTAQNDVTVERNTMNDKWTVSQDHTFAAKTMYKGVAHFDPKVTDINLQPGLNRTPNLYLNTGFALPAYECWTIPNPIPPFFPSVIPICYVRDIESNNSTLINQLKLDILPSTLDGFVQKVDAGDGGYKLSWDPAFKTLADADGDGLISIAHNGLDPNDNSADSDGDGLSDLYEVQLRNAGEPISPVSWDTDGDGLSDAQELALGTSPAIKDTDNDGLSDGEEVYHQVFAFDGNSGKALPTNQWAGGWTVVVTGTQPLSITVSSDPNTPDTDFDGISDQAEKELATNPDVSKRLDPDDRPYHPQIVNKNPLVVLTVVDDTDRIIKPGQAFFYTTTATNLGAPFAAGGLEVNAPAILGAPVNVHRLELDQRNVVTKTDSYQVAGNATSQDVNINSFARARLVNLNPVPWQWLAPTLGQLAGPSQNRPATSVAVAPSNYGRQDMYGVTANVRNDDDFPETQLLPFKAYRGDVKAYGLPGGETRNLEVDDNDTSAMRTQGATDVACTESGKCLYVWDQYDNCRTVNIPTFIVNTSEAAEPQSDIAIYLQRNSSYLRPGENASQLIHSQANLTTGQSQTINKSVQFCGPNVGFQVWEFDTAPVPSSNPPGAATMYNLPLNSFSNNFWSYQATAQDGTVRVTLEVDQVSEKKNLVMGALTGVTPQTLNKAQFALTQNTSDPLTNDFSPAVASNGTDFLVVWERASVVFISSGNFEMHSQIVARRFNSDGVAQSNEVLLSDQKVRDAAPISWQNFTRIDVAWVGDAYRVVWKYDFNPNLQLADFDANGALINGSLRTFANNGTQDGPHISYDPNSGRHIIVYQDSAFKARAILMNNRSDTGTSIELAAGGMPRVAYHPAARGWLVMIDKADFTKQFTYKLLNPDGSLMTLVPEQSALWPTFLYGIINPFDLACPVVQSQPLLTLPFEELPGATTFADTSGNNLTATCSGNGCPLAGVAGAPDAPLSDYSVLFNGLNQKLTVSVPGISGKTFSAVFWLKTAGNVSGDRRILDGGNWAVSMHNNDIVFDSNGRKISKTLTSFDGFHHIAVTQDELKMLLYVDGQLANSDSANVSITAPISLTIGAATNNSQFFAGNLDQLQLWDTALDAASVLGLKNRTLNSYCQAVGASQTAISTVSLNLQEKDIRGGVIKASNGLSLTIDADPPTSTLASLVDGERIRGRNGQTLIIGGNASDKHGIAFVDVSVNNGAFQRASGAAAWTFALPLSEGAITIKTRATDIAGNMEASPKVTTIVVDASAPNPTLTLPSLGRGLSRSGLSVPTAANVPVLQPARQADNHWNVSLNGNVNDPNSGGSAGSGVTKLEVLLQSADPVAVGNDWQPATLNAGTWNLLYAFADGTTDPSGSYTVTVRATDSVGNIGEVDAAVILDSRGPNAILNQSDALRQLIDIHTIKLSGVVSDASGVANLDAIFTPIRQVLAYSDTVMLLSFEESSDDLWFNDRTTFNYDVTCATSGCVTAGQPGRIGKAVRFNNTGVLNLPAPNGFPTKLDFDVNSSLSIQTWLRTSQADAGLLGKENGSNGYALRLNGGKVAFKLNSAVILTSNNTVNDSQWHHVIAIVDHNSGKASLFVDGVAQGSANFSGSLSNAGKLQIGGPGYTGLLDEVAIFNQALTAFAVESLFEAPGVLLRNPATLAQPGLAKTNWQVALPLGLEGQYQLDLDGVDNLNQRTLSAYAWRGLIDTLSPRISYSATVTGKSFSEANGTTRFEVLYSYEAEDRYLIEDGFTGPCSGQSATLRNFAEDAEMGGLFPDLTLRNRLGASCTLWETTATPSAVVKACDRFENCATVAPEVISRTVRQSDSGSVESSSVGVVDALPNAVIVAPTHDSIVAVRNNVLTVTLVAEAAQTLKDVQILLDNAVVQTISFNQSDAVKKVQRTLGVNVATVGEGKHSLAVKASEFSGAVQQAATVINITVDKNDPVAVIDSNTLTSADGFSLGNSMMRIHGNASDTVGLSAVQISVNDGDYEDVTFDNKGDWNTAIYLGDEPAGQQFAIKVKAIDLSGRTVDVLKDVLINVEALALIQTNISSGPGLITSTTSATFIFGGVQGTNNVNSASAEAISNFQCQLDGSAFAPCTSPKTYTGLSNGEHSFRVLASDGKGNIDPSPALYTWDVDSGFNPDGGSNNKIFLPLISRGGGVVARGADYMIGSESVNDATDLLIPGNDNPVEPKGTERLFLPLVSGGQ